MTGHDTDIDRAEVEALVADPGPVDVARADALWARLRTVRPEEILGLWRGEAISTGHPIERVLVGSSWYGKDFRAVDDAHPLICRGPTGELISDTTTAHGTASLWDVSFRGEVTATMVYDGRPVLDHFKRVDEITLLGVMNGKGVLHDGAHFYFVLRRA